ncbi:MAG: RhuM family protein, partial [Candidatus Delongbacteria bacterium]|nr:RhuM family protein [Candidatus Delongbacteria bacterium]MDD3045750.1 RhuM family protein [Candidatus Delongbacteria bacterium]
QYLIFAEGQAMRRVAMHMNDWIKKLDSFLTINDREILEHAGKVSHELAMEIADNEYEKFSQSRLEDAKYALNDFDKAVKQITHIKKKS